METLPARAFVRQLPAVLGAVLVASCGDAPVGPGTPVGPEPVVYEVPVVVHVIHHGEPVGTGHNLSRERIEGQLRVLNEDFRRTPGTRGFNTHPDGADARIEFVLATIAPDGTPTDGVVRLNANAAQNPTPPGSLFDHFAWYSYWDPARYVNVWSMPLDSSTRNVFLGKATGPDTDLPGGDRFERGEPFQAEGILINSWHFGETGDASPHNLGRTLTHEMGHYLGLLHLWGAGDCANNDYCDDTPPLAAPVLGGCPGPPPPACDGRPAMVENYMGYASDACMNVFTRDQVARMRYVLEHSPRRPHAARSQ